MPVDARIPIPLGLGIAKHANLKKDECNQLAFTCCDWHSDGYAKRGASKATTMDARPHDRQTTPDSRLKQSTSNIHSVKEKIYNFFLEIVRTWEPETVLLEFKHLFVEPIESHNLEVEQAIYTIIVSEKEAEFRNTLKRLCYILINNWWSNRQYGAILNLIQLFEEIPIHQTISSVAVTHLNRQIKSFVTSQDYQEIKVFASVFEDRQKGYWSQRYTAYLLAPQYIDLKNPIEQREVTQKLAKQLKDKFKLDLAMYTARAQSLVVQESVPKNPTRLGEQALELIKKIVAKRGLFGYANLASIFLKQNHQVNYWQFKQNLQKYIFYSLSAKISLLRTLKVELAKKLELLYQERNAGRSDSELLLRTCNHLINYLTSENGKPTQLFVLLVTEEEALTLAIVLLKIILICRNTRARLEAKIANLIQYYQEFPEADCWGVIHFLEVLNIVLTVYTEDVEYNLVNLTNGVTDESAIAKQQTYRVFSQLKSDVNLKGANLKGSHLQGADLSGVNLDGANLSGANLIDADLSNARLTNVDFSGANLTGANLFTADLNHANLSSANLRSADLRRTNLSGANLDNANLIAAKMRLADLRAASLKAVDLGAANMNGANLSGVDLAQINLRHANLSEANLSGANLSGTNLSMADLSGTNLTGVNLSNANARHANLMGACLQETNLSGADLGRADLRGARLGEIKFHQTKMENARCGDNPGISPQTKQILQRLGAIFDEDLRQNESEEQ